MQKKSYIFLLGGIFLLFGSLPACFAQWKAVYYELHPATSHYDISKDTELGANPISGPRYSNLFGYQHSYPLIDHTKERSVRSYEKKFTNKIAIRKDTTYVRIAAYTEGIDSYLLRFHETNDDVWYEKKVTCTNDKFQPLVFFPLSDLAQEFSGVVMPQIDRLILVCDSLADTPVMLVQELSIVDYTYVENQCVHPFIHAILSPDDPTMPKVDIPSLAILNDNPEHVLIESEESFEMGRMANYFNFERDTLIGAVPESEIGLLKKIIEQTIEYHPFYEERNLDKNQIRNRWNSFAAAYGDDGEALAFGRALASFIRNEFKDPHFLVEAPAEAGSRRKVSGPVRLYPIRGEVLVAGVFREEHENIPLGSRILMIDDMPVDSLIEASRADQLGMPERQYMRAVSQLLFRYPTDSVMLTYQNRNTGKTEDALLKYDGALRIPASFRPSHGRFEIRDSVAYIGINQMDDRIFRQFVNRLDEIIMSKALVIDLRGNPGGSSYFGEKVFSFFIDKPTAYSHHIPLENGHRRQSRVLAPDPEIHFPENFPVVIIGDENTACACEDFIQAMKKLPRCLYISHSRTNGALQNRYGISFPSGLFLSLDCLTGKIYSEGIGIVEVRGIEPDIWVQPSCIEDLAPYNDLLKETAFKIATAKYW